MQERDKKGAREGHEMCTRGAREVHLWALKWKRYFHFDTLGTLVPKVHKRGKGGAQEVRYNRCDMHKLVLVLTG